MFAIQSSEGMFRLNVSAVVVSHGVVLPDALHTGRVTTDERRWSAGAVETARLALAGGRDARGGAENRISDMLLPLITNNSEPGADVDSHATRPLSTAAKPR